jgi:uncharacterized protein YceK
MRIRSLCLLLVVATLGGCGPMATTVSARAMARAVAPARVLTGDELPGVLLSAADLPPGWTEVLAGTANAASQVSGCGTTASTRDPQAAVAFSKAVLGPYLAETLAVTPSARNTVERLRQVIADCAQVSVTPLDVPPMGDDSTAFALEAGVPGVGMSLHGQVVAVSRGDVLMVVTVVGMSTVDTPTTVLIARQALAKLG